MKQKCIYWERYPGDMRPAPIGAWVFDDGHDDAFLHVWNYDALPFFFNIMWWFDLEQGEDISGTLDDGQLPATRYYHADGYTRRA
jgi:hypothetical protein